MCYFEDSNVFGQDTELLSEQFLLHMTALPSYSLSSSFLLGLVNCEDITIVAIIGSHSTNNVSHPKTLVANTVVRASNLTMYEGGLISFAST